ncbi:hypothetical protein LJB75_00075 [Bacteroidales bacterium OttesenSCG-928-L19]|nr:hypothetical protein [Bacteroidales bacterium OttesenSCG-928-L19]
MSDKRNFMQRNLTKIHIAGMALGVTLSLIYWYLKGQYSENMLKNSPVLMAIWGILIGYITFDLIKGSRNRQNENNE